MKPLTTPQIDRKISLSSLGLLWERLWAALCWPLTYTMALLALVYSGLLLWLPPYTRLGLVTGLALLVLMSARHLPFVRLPSRAEAMRRIEQASALANRPISSARDKLATPLADPTSEMIWQEHKRREWARLGNVAVPVPRSAWRDIDPASFRNAAALAMLAAFFLGPGNSLTQTLSGPGLVAAAPAETLTIDAWLRPPAYTGKPPLLLTSPAQREALKQNPVILVPAHSRLTLRVQGAAEPRLAFFDFGSSEQTSTAAKVRNSGSAFEADADLTEPATLRLMDGNRELAAWTIDLIPDHPPAVAFTAPAETAATGALSLKWKATDDYGVSRLTAAVELADEQDEGVGFEGNGVFLFDAPKLPVTLRKRAPKEEQGTTTADLTAHPWAGLNVTVQLTAHDGAKQTGVSEARVIRLPERLFTRPMARAIIEQRKSLIMDTDNAERAARLIETMLLYPAGLIERTGTHIALAGVLSQLRNAESREQYESVVSELWKIAVLIEDGELGTARDQLEQARRALEEALRNGASPEQLKQAMDKLRQAMDRYLNEMSRQARRNPQTGNQQEQQAGRTLRRQDLQKMLDDIEKMAQGGAREQAQEMLSQLDQMLKNLQMAQPQQGSGEQSEGQRALDKLSEMMRKQQQLMDETQRGEPQGGSPDKDQLGQQGDDPGNRSGNRGNGTLEGRQGDLQEMLNQMLGELGQNGIQVPQSLGEAGRDMGSARDALREGENRQALGSQGEALRKLREGARELSRQMQQRNQGNQNAQGRDGEGRGDDNDPLGRPLPSDAEQRGPDKDMVPTERAIRRAQEILQNLRDRANTPDLPEIDRDYIDRLLRGLF